jgi:hypothetical protein
VIDMADVTFRDFAGAVMQGNAAAAASTLETLLALEPADAAAAAAHFQAQMAAGGPAFMGKAMGLRTAVASGSDAEVAALLAECFGLVEPTLGRAVAAVRGSAPG